MRIHSTKKEINVTVFKDLKISVCINRSVNEIGIMATVGNGNVILLCADIPLNISLSDNAANKQAIETAINWIANEYGDYFDFKEMTINQQFDHAITFIHNYEILSDLPVENKPVEIQASEIKAHDKFKYGSFLVLAMPRFNPKENEKPFYYRELIIKRCKITNVSRLVMSRKEFNIQDHEMVKLIDINNPLTWY